MRFLTIHKMLLYRIFKSLKRKVKSLLIEYYKNHNKKKYAECLFLNTFGDKIDWDAPRDLNEWINWLAFNTDTTEWSKLADKYKVRDYVKEKGLSDILIPLYGVWDDPNDIEFDKLPQSFVLKCNNGSGDIILINDKSKIDRVEVVEQLRNNLKSKFGLETGEPHYLRIQPKIIAEHLLDKRLQEFNSSSLIDYKFWCIDGNVLFCWVDWNRDYIKHTLTVKIYDRDWHFCPQYHKDCMNIIVSNDELAKPEKWEEMIDIAERLSLGFPQVRVDLYFVDCKIYFGEMTFTSACGRMTYFSDEAQVLLGNKCKEAVNKLYIHNVS